MVDVKHLEIPSDAKEDVALARDTLLSKYGDNISKIILFGSYANGTYQPNSDIDLCIVLKELPPKKQRAEYRFAVDIENRETDLLYCTKDHLDSDTLIYKWINEEGVVLYEQL